MSWIDPRVDHNHRVPLVKAIGKQLTKQRIGLLLGPVLFLMTLAIPEPQSMVDAAGEKGVAAISPLVALGTLLWVLAWWVTECVPLGVAALVPPLVFSIAGILSWSTSLTSFTNPIIWIFMAGFVLAACFRKWELDRRIAIRLGSMYKGRNPMVAAFFVAALPVFILTLTGSITASTSVVFPFLIAYLSMANVKPGGRYSEACMLVLAQAATAGAMLLLISTPPNLIAKETVEAYSPTESITFLDWLFVGTPHAFIGLVVAWFVVFKVLRPKEEIEVDSQRLAAARTQLGRMSTGEKVVAGLLLVAISLWILPSAVKAIATYDPSLEPLSSDLSKIMPEAMPAVLVILLAGIIRIKREPLLKWDEIARGIDWNVVFLFGGGIALGLGLESSGFAGWLAGVVKDSLGDDPSEWSIYAVSCLLGFALTYAASNTAAALITCPLAATLALGAGMSPVAPVVGAALACSVSSAIPSTTPPMAIVYSSGYVKIWSMFKVGVISDVIRIVALILVGFPLVNLVY